jgi:hypothetical protein
MEHQNDEPCLPDEKKRWRLISSSSKPTLRTRDDVSPRSKDAQILALQIEISAIYACFAQGRNVHKRIHGHRDTHLDTSH